MKFISSGSCGVGNWEHVFPCGLEIIPEVFEALLYCLVQAGLLEKCQVRRGAGGGDSDFCMHSPFEYLECPV